MWRFGTTERTAEYVTGISKEVRWIGGCEVVLSLRYVPLSSLTASQEGLSFVLANGCPGEFVGVREKVRMKRLEATYAIARQQNSQGGSRDRFCGRHVVVVGRKGEKVNNWSNDLMSGRLVA